MHGMMSLNVDQNHLHNLEKTITREKKKREREAAKRNFFSKIPKNCTKIELKDSAIHKTSHPSYRDLQAK